VILAETSLYAESGGQVADKGVIVGPGYELEVLDVQRPVPGLVHTVEVTSGEVGVGQPATSVVDAVNRRAAQQAHSATHLVHAALRDTLGKSATQAGSLNRAGYMRFDFSWGQTLSEATKTEIEEIANNAVRDNLQVTTRVLPLDEAKAAGAMALFGEKYGDTVRMVDIGGPWSRELCGGTHVGSSAEIGLINLVGESSVGASTRRGSPRRSRRLPGARRRARHRLAAVDLAEDAEGPARQPGRRSGREPEGRREAHRPVRGEGSGEPAAGTGRSAQATGRSVSSPSRWASRHRRTMCARSPCRCASAWAPVPSSRSAPSSAAGPSSSSPPTTLPARRERRRACSRRTPQPRSAAAAADVTTSRRAAERIGCPPARARSGDARWRPRRVSGFRPGVRLGIDVGKARIGVARCDRDGLLAVPVETVRERMPRRRTSRGSPRSTPRWNCSSGCRSACPVETASTDDARAFASEVRAASGLEVRLVDERLSTVSAHAALRDAGRSQRSSRRIVDQVAAVVLLQQAIDVEKSTGAPAGAVARPAGARLMPDTPPNDDEFADLFSKLPTPREQAPSSGGAASVPPSRRAAREAAANAARDTAPSPPARRSRRRSRAQPRSRDPRPEPPRRPRTGVESRPLRSSAARCALQRGLALRPRARQEPRPRSPQEPHRGLGDLRGDPRDPRRHRGGGFYVWNTYEDKIRAFMGWEEPKDYEDGIAEGDATVTIVTGDTGSTISTSLFQAGVTKTDTAFYDYLIKTGQNPDFQPGVYTLKQKMSSAAALKALEGPSSRRENTAQLPEGLTMGSTLTRLADGTGIPLADLQAAVADPSQYGVSATTLEGWLFPATYTFDPGTTAQQVIKTWSIARWPLSTRPACRPTSASASSPSRRSSSARHDSQPTSTRCPE
jgi:Ser-tRNA(Ala) deacylase AlaX/RNase H-fold protein (predicted Holliday junction resolvase)